MTGLHTSQLNRAIASGAEEGIFALPKGSSGKVKLAPKVKPAPAKEVRLFLACIVRLLTVSQNTKPTSKSSVVKKAPAEKAEKPTKAAATKAAAAKAAATKAASTKVVPKKKAVVAKPASPKKISSARAEKKQVCTSRSWPTKADIGCRLLPRLLLSRQRRLPRRPRHQQRLTQRRQAKPPSHQHGKVYFMLPPVVPTSDRLYSCFRVH